jgi:hypothetical protein
MAQIRQYLTICTILSIKPEQKKMPNDLRMSALRIIILETREYKAMVKTNIQIVTRNNNTRLFNS